MLSFVPGIYSRHINALLERIGSPQAIFNSSKQTLQKAGLDEKLASAVFQSGRHPDDDLKKALEKTLRWAGQAGHSILTRQCQDYPAFLARIPDPPPLLYLKGDPALLYRPQLAMVGSRNPSAGGRRNARWFAGELSRAGITIISGLAMGIDAESHGGALGNSGSTIAVLGTGIDRVYPARHADLFGRIAEQGLLVSEFPLGTAPVRMNFPRRNRMISGLSMGVLVVEASLKSGSMITARYALEQGREVYAIPGSIHNPVARGCHKLISQGAKLVEKVEDIVEECGGMLEAVRQQVAAVNKLDDQLLDNEMKQVLKVIGFDVVFPDQIMSETGLASEQVSAALTNLELQGLILRQGGGFTLAN